MCVKSVLLTVMLGAVLSSALQGCQFPDYGFTSGVAGAPAGGMPGDSAGASGEAGEGGDAAAGAAGAVTLPTAPCSPKQDCVPGAQGWKGPMAFWEGEAGALDAPPDCPSGYAKPKDLHRELIAPASACKCTCTAQDQVCDGSATLRIFSDKSCATACATTTLKACGAVSGCTGSQGSVSTDIGAPSGGTCRATTSKPPEPTWKYDARLCPPSGASSCDADDEVCAPTPEYPYLTQLCVMRVISAGSPPPNCPADYPNPSPPLYTEVADSRDCSECSCGAVTGGSCEGKLVMSAGGSCDGKFEDTLGNGCTSFNLGAGDIHPSRVGAEYELTPGSCSVASAPRPIGEAVPSGSVTVVCCQ